MAQPALASSLRSTAFGLAFQTPRLSPTRAPPSAKDVLSIFPFSHFLVRLRPPVHPRLFYFISRCAPISPMVSGFCAGIKIAQPRRGAENYQTCFPQLISPSRVLSHIVQSRPRCPKAFGQFPASVLRSCIARTRASGRVCNPSLGISYPLRVIPLFSCSQTTLNSP